MSGRPRKWHLEFDILDLKVTGPDRAIRDPVGTSVNTHDSDWPFRVSRQRLLSPLESWTSRAGEPLPRVCDCHPQSDVDEADGEGF